MLIVGDSDSGKTSIISRYIYSSFAINKKATIGCDFFQKTIEWNMYTRIKLVLWDVAGQVEDLFYLDFLLNILFTILIY